MNLLPYGPRAVLAEFATLDEVVAAAGAWRAARLPGVVDVVPAARTVLVAHDGTLDVALLTATAVVASPSAAAAAVVIDTVYDGEDLAAVAATAGWSAEELVRRHSDATYTVAFCGFMPGFPYLTGLPAELELPRLASPRERVPAGSVALAAGYCGIYPRESPGGWHLLGRTHAVLWADDRDPPALLPPGTTVRFRPA